MITGSALGIFLLYLVEDVQAAVARRPGGGPLDDPGPSDPGSLADVAGRIAIQPLETFDDGVPEVQPQGAGGSNGQPSLDPGTKGSRAPLPEAPQQRGGLPAPEPVLFQPLALGGGVDRGEPGSYQGGTPAEPTPEPEQKAAAPAAAETPPPTLRPLPQLMLVVVRGFAGSSSRTVEGVATSYQETRQVGVQNSVLDLRDSDLPGMRIQSDRTVASMARSELDDADLALVAQHLGLLDTTLLNGQLCEGMIVNVRDLLQLGLFTPRTATAGVDARVISLTRSTLEGQQGDDLVSVDGGMTLRFIGLGGSERANLCFDLLTTALKDSGILLGEGNDRITINSGFTVAPGDFIRDPLPRGLDFDLGVLPQSLGDGSNWSFNLNARAIGLDNSLLDLGDGDDSVSILTRIDGNPADDLGILAADPFTHINLERVGMLNSRVNMGDGNDEVVVNGDIINSIIDLGSGDNTLILEGELKAGSSILMGNGNNKLITNASLGGMVQGGDGPDTFQLNKVQLAGELDGAAGQDALIAPSGAGGRSEVLLVNQSNAGTLDGLKFRNIESLDLGSGNDVALIGIEGTLTGRLFGGDGLDRLEFNNWTLPVSVDLDRGSATAIGGGAAGAVRGFEQVIGGLGSDILSSSGAFAGIDGNDGDDLLFLRWSPWLTEGDRRLQVRGGTGRDLFVISGLEDAPPAWWDGRSGLPDLVDLDQSGTADGSIGLTDTIGWLRREPVAGGGSKDVYQQLTPSGVAGVGDARLLPIAPLEQLLAGMSTETRQLAIAFDGHSEAQLVLLGSQGIGTSRAIANIPSVLGTQGWSPVSGASGSTP